MVHSRSYPTRTQQTLTQQPSWPQPGPALHLLHGRWVASCPACGYQLASSRSQERCDRRGRRRTCPICQEGGLP
jgi:hypothetical protein